MNFTKRLLPIFIILLSVFLLYPTYHFNTELIYDPITKTKMRLMPITTDFRNYFILQSIDDVTNVIIGDFVGSEKIICVITDKNNDGKDDTFLQYYPDRKKFTRPAKPSTDLYENFKKSKKEIINGEIFRNSYSYKMGDLLYLKKRISEGVDIFKSGHGYSIKIYDPDNVSTIMNEFYFARKGDRYDLQFKTNYYKIFNTKIAPPIKYSVYCKNSKDPTVKETVEELISLIQ